MYTQNEKILTTPIEEDMKSSYLDYAMSVIIGRALPDVRDGLKPVHRRILYAMNEMGLSPNKSFKKSARIVGEVLGKYHPHGDSAVYDSMVRMAQSFSLRYPMVNGQGNFGSIDGDSAAAMRYTEVKLQKISSTLMDDIDKDTVDFSPNYDESLKEPDVLPSRLPNLLLNGSSGIAVGMATNIPPHNLTEIVDGIKFVIDSPECSVDELAQIIKGPDFPTGGIIMGNETILTAYRTGRCPIRVRGKAGIEPTKQGKECIIISEIPYMVNKTNLIEKIVSLIQEKKITGISDMRDESDKDGMRIVIELKRGEIPKVVLNQLYKHTPLESSFGINMLAITKGKPVVMNLKEIITNFVEFRIEVVTRRTQFELNKAQARAHILEGLKIALSNIDDVVKIIRGTKNKEEAKQELMPRFGLSEVQANAILEMRLYQLTALEQDKLEEEYQKLMALIEKLTEILENEQVMKNLIKTELDEIKATHGDERRTEIVPGGKNLRIEDLIANESCVITISKVGYIKRVPVSTYRQQHRGGKGVTGMETREEDFVEHLFVASTHDYIMFFTSQGRVHWLKVYEIPQASRTSKGKAVVNILNLNPDEKIAAMIRTKNFKEWQYLLMATKNGIIKKTALEAYSRPKRTGIIAINIDDDDDLIEVMPTSGQEDALLVTKFGQSIRFSEEQVRETGRATRGVKGITLDQNDEVVSLSVVENEEETLLVVCENGFGKRTPFEQYRAQNRGGKGIITIKATVRNGKVVGALKVTDNDALMMTTASGKLVRIPIEGISVIGRNTQGVTLIGLGKNDCLVDVCKVAKEDDEEVEKAEEAEKQIEQAAKQGEARAQSAQDLDPDFDSQEESEEQDEQPMEEEDDAPSDELF